MNLGKLAVLAAAIAAAPFAANAQDAGVTVFGNDDQPAGTIVSNDGTNAVLDTGKHQVPLPLATYAEREGKWTINATKAQINTLVDQQMAAAAAQLDAALVQGAAVVSADAQPAGMVLAIDTAADQIIVENETGIVSLKREHFAVDAAGKLTALYTGAQLAQFTTAVPEGAEIRTTSGTLVRAAAGAEEAEGETTASAASVATTGASQ